MALHADDNFFNNVYQIVRLIPAGRVTSYGAIARCLGSAGSARMVGWAMGHLPTVPVDIPAQRVVNSAGLLSGKHHFGPGDEMKDLLEAEGVMIENNKVKDFKTIFWDPVQELGI
ncbi:MAG: MGMT family protein [Bacteroidota bacterium]